VVKCSDISEEHTASIFRVSELVQVDAAVICVGCIGWWEGVLAITAAVGGRANRIPPEPTAVDTYENVSLQGLNIFNMQIQWQVDSDQKYTLFICH
jgi:hypothetical protein